MPCKYVAEERRDETRNGKAALRGRRIATLVSAKGMYYLLLLACEPQQTLCCRIFRETTVLIKQAVLLRKSYFLDFDSGEGEAKLVHVAQQGEDSQV